MRSLIILIVISLIFIISLLITAESHENFFIFQFSAIPIIAAALFFSGREALIVTAVSCLLTATFIIMGIGIGDIIHSILFLAVSAALSCYLRYLTDRIMSWKKKVIEVIKEEHRASFELGKKTENDKIYLEKSVYDISSLYQAPKKMISSVTFDDLLEALRKSFEGYFSFKRCKIIISSFKEKESKADRIYTIPQKEPTDKTDTKGEESLANFMRSNKEPLIFDRGLNMALPEGIVLSDEIETFVAVPLVAGERCNGIFTVEDIAPDDIVRFMIMSHQFAMVLERTRLYELVQELAVTDGLTGVFVRRYFLERLKEEIERAKYFNTRLSFIMIDIDNFKNCNDRFGHLVGDVVLKEAANILKKNLRDIDIIGRYGGEEFSVILPDTIKEGAAIVGERLRSAVEHTKIKAYDEAINTTISAGVASFPDDTYDINQLIDRADQMLYKAKEKGRNRVKVYGQEE